MTYDPEAIVVLMVDDQAMVAEAVRRMVADQSDIQFHYQGNASQAVEAAVQLRPTVILQDLVMPDVDGLTLITRYRGEEATQDVPIIVLSSKEDAVIKRDAFRGGAND